MSAVKFGVLGAGFIGRSHMNSIVDNEEAHCVGIFDPSAKLADDACKNGQADKAYATAEELIACPEVDAIIVASPNTTHAELAVKALEKGKHVIVEKPLALTGKQASGIAKAAKKAGTVTLVPHQMRWTGAAQKIRKLEEDGELGKVYYTKTAWLRPYGIPGWGSWFTRFDESGGGPLIDIGVHMLDLSLYLMGGVKPVSVYGSTYAEFGPRKLGLGTWGTPDWDGFYDVEDLASALIKMDNGATLHLEVSWAANVSPDDATPRISLMGTEGGAAMTMGAKNIKLTGMKFGQSFSIDSPVPEVEARKNMLQHFVECVKTGEQTIAPVASGMVNNVVLDSIYESSKTGKSVDIDWASYQ